MQWYYSNKGTQAGPISQDELKAKVASGEVQGEDLAWHEGMPDWLPVSKIEELSGGGQASPAAVPAPAPEAAAPAGAAPTSVASGATPVAGASPYQTPNSPSVPAAGPMAGGDIPTYMWQSIVVTLLCCLPFGIAAIVYAAKVDGLKKAGDLVGARTASDTAKKWCWVAFALGLVVIVIQVIVMVAGGMAPAPQ